MFVIYILSIFNINNVIYNNYITFGLFFECKILNKFD